MATAPLGHVSALHMAPPFLRPRRMVATAALSLEKATGIRASAVSPVTTVTAPQRHASTARSLELYNLAWYGKLMPAVRK